MENIRFASATKEQIPSLFQILNDVYRIEVGNSGVGFKKEGEERYQNHDQIRELFAEGEMIVAEDANTSEVVGCIFYRIFHDEEGKKRLYFGPLASIRKGVGKALIILAEEKAAKEQCESVDIRVVDVRSDVLPMYQRNGYVIYGERIPFPDPDVCVREVFFVLLRKNLK